VSVIREALKSGSPKPITAMASGADLCDKEVDILVNKEWARDTDDVL
jgi:hypothetical protein